MSRSLRNPAVVSLIQACEKHAVPAMAKDASLLTYERLSPIASALADIKASDVALEEPRHWIHSKYRADVKGDPPSGQVSLLQNLSPAVYCHSIYETELFQIIAFVIPPGASIPIHDHPNMSVISSVLYGEMDVWSCDWKDPFQQETNAVHGGPVRVVDNHVRICAGSVKMLLPHQGGNLHQFSCPLSSHEEKNAVGSAILDVILPPYDEYQGRACSYFSKRFYQEEIYLEPADYPDFTVETI